MATAQQTQMQPSATPSALPVQFPPFPRTQQNNKRQPSMAPFAAPPSFMRDELSFVPARPTLPPFTPNLGPRSATPVSSISPLKAAITREELVRLIEERLCGHNLTQPPGRSTTSTSRSVTISDDQPGNTLVLTRVALELMIQDIVQ